jgi:hypothetical protein
MLGAVGMAETPVQAERLALTPTIRAIPSDFITAPYDFPDVYK